MSLSHAHDASYTAMLIHRATRFIVAHQAEHLDSEHLIKRCCAHLMATAGLSESAAQHYTMHALADLQAKHVPAYVDINHSTSYVVRVVDPAMGHVYTLTASDILQLARAHSDDRSDGAAHVIKQCGRRAG